jgi:hypothetical protein
MAFLPFFSNFLTPMVEQFVSKMPVLGPIMQAGQALNPLQSLSKIPVLGNILKNAGPMLQKQAMSNLFGGGQQQQRKPISPPTPSAPPAPPNTAPITGQPGGEAAPYDTAAAGGGGKQYSFTPQQLDTIGGMKPDMFNQLHQNGFFDSFESEVGNA